MYVFAHCQMALPERSHTGVCVCVCVGISVSPFFMHDCFQEQMVDKPVCLSVCERGDLLDSSVL